jgi:thiol-disulfide isomerase/thioredoxin
MTFSTIFLAVAVSMAALSADYTSPTSEDREVPVVNFEQFQQYLTEFGDKTLVINFWATWCVPCVKELPYFEQVTTNYSAEEVEVILVSLDFSNLLDSSVIPFIEKNNLQSKVILLDDPEMNTWIDKVNRKWSGAIPATLIKSGDKEAFYEKSFHSFEELQQIIQPFLKS